MSNAYALLVGLKSIDPAAHNGWDGKSGCWGCEIDVDNMKRILKSQGYRTRVLKTKKATRNKVLSSLYTAAENLSPGDVFLFYYSGHGGQQPDRDKDEADGKDETLVVYDREIIDDKIHQALAKFKAGVHVVMISDSCNSGSNYRGRRDVAFQGDSTFRPVAKNLTEDNAGIKAQLIHMGGCRDGFTSEGYYGGGAFTMALCSVWDNGGFAGTYKELHDRIRATIRSDQQPQYSEYGPVSEEFRNGRAFSSVIASAVPKVQDSELMERIATLENQDILNPDFLRIFREEIEKGFVSKKELEERVLSRLAKEGYLSQDKLIGALAAGAMIVGGILYSPSAR